LNLIWDTAEVQTATANIPAIRLYKKFGFCEHKRWHSDETIELILLSNTNAN
jgi:hypothetical protein